jgi:hypothetical protein
MTTEYVNSFFLPVGIFDGDDEDKDDVRVIERGANDKGRGTIRPPPGFATSSGGISSAVTTNSSNTTSIIKASQLVFGIQAGSPGTSTQLCDANSPPLRETPAPIGTGRSFLQLQPHHRLLFSSLDPTSTTNTNTNTTSNSNNHSINIDNVSRAAITYSHSRGPSCSRFSDSGQVG